MRRKFLFLCLCLSSCAPVPQYYVKNSVAEMPETGKSFWITSPHQTVSSTKMTSYIKDYLKNNGYKVVDNRKNARYGLALGVESQSWQTQRTVPVWGKTGINSINTNSYGTANTNLYGTANRYGNTTAYNANALTNYSGNSYTTVDYDYGVTGYQNVIDNHHKKWFQIVVMDYKTNNVIVESTITTPDYIDDDSFILYVQQIYNNTSIFTPIDEELYCEAGVCEEPKTLIQRVIE